MDAGGPLTAIEKRDFAEHVARFGIVEHDLAPVGGNHADPRQTRQHDEQCVAFIALRHQLLLALERFQVAAQDDVGQLGLFAIGKQALRRERGGEFRCMHDDWLCPRERGDASGG